MNGVHILVSAESFHCPTMSFESTMNKFGHWICVLQSLLQIIYISV